MAFLVQWLWYLLAFVLGSLVAWLIVIVTVRRTTRDAATADLPESHEAGGR